MGLIYLYLWPSLLVILFQNFVKPRNVVNEMCLIIHEFHVSEC